MGESELRKSVVWRVYCLPVFKMHNVSVDRDIFLFRVVYT